MGIWGTAILSNDFAGDISFQYKDLLGDNHSAEHASRQVIEEFLSELESDEHTAFWLSFALLQWKAGRLQEEVKNKALEIVDSGSDLEQWAEDPKLMKKRKAVLVKLKDQLQSPQPQAKKVPKRFITDTPFKTGEAVSYQLLSGDYIILKVVDIIEQWTGDRYPLFDICDWQGKEIPSKAEIDELQPKPRMWESGEQELNRVGIFPAGKRDDPSKRLQVVARDVTIAEDQQASTVLLTWKSLDGNLKEYYGME